jgi:hypothetical protein
VKTLVIVTCVKKKRKGRHKAKDLYISDLFKKMRHYAETNNYDWRIISAKHGLIDPETIIESYEDESLDQFKLLHGRRTDKLKTKKETLRKKIEVQLKPTLEDYERIILMCGKNYRDVILPFLKGKEVINYFEKTKGIGDMKRKLSISVAKKKQRTLDECLPAA